MADVTEILSQAMTLPIPQRAQVAHQLLVSLDQEREPATRPLEETLMARQARVAAGEHTSYDASETLDRMKRSLDERSTK